jgi:hypothetical protein
MSPNRGHATIDPVHEPEPPRSEREPPRASLIAMSGELCASAILFGGAHTPHGNDVLLEGLERAWVIDCAGDMPRTYRERAERWYARVFPDLDGDVPALLRLRELVGEVAVHLQAGNGAPDRIYVMCQHGMNRSALVTGMLLRELGLGGEEALRRLVAARPGALSNHAFRRIVEG